MQPKPNLVPAPTYQLTELAPLDNDGYVSTGEEPQEGLWEGLSGESFAELPGIDTHASEQLGSCERESTELNSYASSCWDRRIQMK